jgi:hypothetical protein
MESREIPVDIIKEKYKAFTSKVTAFLHGEVPVTKSEMLAFISLATQHETDLTSLKSSIGLIYAQIQKDYNDQMRDVHAESKPANKRITKHEIDMMQLDARLVDLKYKLDCLEVYSNGLESFKWLLKFRREQADQHFKHLKGIDF